MVKIDIFNDTDDDLVLAAYALSIVEDVSKGGLNPNSNIISEQLAIILNTHPNGPE